MSLKNYLTTNLQLINVSNIGAFGIDIKVISYFCCTNLAEIAILTQTYIYTAQVKKTNGQEKYRCVEIG